MQEIYITDKEEGQRLDKILRKYLGDAPDSFLYKMLRKKNIKRNGKKAQGREKLRAGDVIALYLSDDTIEKFQKPGVSLEAVQKPGDILSFPEVIYENEDFLLMNKPAGLLSQKASKGDISINEQMILYCLEKGLVTKEALKIRKPSIVNRLDRNTTGLIAAGISIKGLTFLSGLFRERNLEKYYFTIVEGKLRGGMDIKGYLTKDRKTNRVTVKEKKQSESDSYIETSCEPLNVSDGPAFEEGSRLRGGCAGGGKACGAPGYTLLKVKLVTGKPHQIRAHLAHAGHPILGDAKYGNRDLNRYWEKEAGLTHQLLHSGCLVFPALAGEWERLSGRYFTAPKPEQFICIEEKIFGGCQKLWEPGTQGGLGVRP